MKFFKQCWSYFSYKPTQLLVLFIAICVLIAVYTSHLRPEDFCQDYYAARYFVEHLSIYSPNPCPIFKYSAHPPISILLYLPFNALPLQLASFIWSLLSLACYLVAGFLLLWVMGWVSLRSFVLFSLGSVFWSYHLAASIVHNIGQLFLLLIVSAYVLRKSNHFYLSGIVLGILSLLKIWPFIFVFSALLTDQKKVATAGFLTVFIGSLLSFFILMPNTYITYFSQVSVYEERWLHYPTNISLIGTMMHLFTSFGSNNGPLIHELPSSLALNLGFGFSIIVAVGVFCLIYWQSRRSNIKGDQDFLLEGLSITTALLAFPLMWDWNVIYCLLPCALLLKHILAFPKQPFWWYVLCAIGFLAIFNPVHLLTLIGFRYHLKLLDREIVICISLTFGLICLSLAQIVSILRSKYQSVIQKSIESIVP